MLKEHNRREFPFYHAPGKKLFQIVVKLSDAPGSLSSILQLLRTKINLIGTSTYTLNDGTAMLSAFAESLSDSNSAEELRRLILSSKAAIEADVRASSDGMLVDTFHSGLDVGGEDYMLMRRETISHMFDQVVKMLGSGGEALLYREGLAMGRWDAKWITKLLGLKDARAKNPYLSRILAAQGWGIIGYGPAQGRDRYVVKIEKCFESEGGAGHRQSCSLMRGYVEGYTSALFGTEYESSETRCTLRGDKHCEILLVARPK